MAASNCFSNYFPLFDEIDNIYKGNTLIGKEIANNFILMLEFNGEILADLAATNTSDDGFTEQHIEISALWKFTAQYASTEPFFVSSCSSLNPLRIHHHWHTNT